MAGGTSTRDRQRLTRERIVEAAVALADAGGSASLSMRNLADELGAGTMALYRHVANKEDLLDGMVDVVFGEMYAPAIGSRDWKLELRERGTSARAALQRHPWAVGLMETRMQSRSRERRAPQRDDGVPPRGGVPVPERRARVQPARQLHVRLRAAGADGPVRDARGVRRHGRP